MIDYVTNSVELDRVIVADPDLVIAKTDLAHPLATRRETDLVTDLLSVNATDLALDLVTDVNQSRKLTAMITVRLMPPLLTIKSAKGTGSRRSLF